MAQITGFSSASGGLQRLLESFFELQYFAGPIQMIAEEWDEQSGESLARRLATARGIDWLYMDMRTEEKIRAGIEEKQRDRRVSGQQLKLPSDDLREHAWADKLEASGREHVLVVCGYFHLDGLVRKLRARGHETAQRVYLESVTEIRES